MIVDAENQILGRMLTHVAKTILNGEKVDIVNCEKAVVSGKKAGIIAGYTQKTMRGTPFKGPFWPRKEEMVVRRAARGMLPWKEARGQAAYKNLRCYVGIPEEFNGKKLESFKDASVSSLNKAGYMTIRDISKGMGKKIK